MKKLCISLIFSFLVFSGVLFAQGGEFFSMVQGGPNQLQMAVSSHDYEGVRNLLESGADPNEEVRDNHSRIVHLAVDANQYRITKLLIDYGADINAQTTDGWTPLLFACYKGYTKIARLLIAAGAGLEKRTGKGVTALIYAVVPGHRDIVSDLILAGADVNAKDDREITSLMMASEGGFIEIARKLLEAGADINAQPTGWTALHYASDTGNKDMVDLLFSYDASPDSGLKRGQEEGNRNLWVATPLMFAVDKGHFEVAKRLLEAGADVNAQTAEGNTALIVAAKKERPEMIKLLLAAGANTELKDNDDYRAQDYVSQLWTSEAHYAFVEAGVLSPFLIWLRRGLIGGFAGFSAYLALPDILKIVAKYRNPPIQIKKKRQPRYTKDTTQIELKRPPCEGPQAPITLGAGKSLEVAVHVQSPSDSQRNQRIEKELLNLIREMNDIAHEKKNGSLESLRIKLNALLLESDELSEKLIRKIKALLKELVELKLVNKIDLDMTMGLLEGFEETA